MTIFVLYNNPAISAFNKEAENVEGQPMTAVAEKLLYTIPDTALLRNSKPFFIPDYANPCMMEMQLGIRVSRLGRTISERFAYRYWDAATVVAHFIAEPLLHEAQEKGLPWSCATGFDSAVPVGRYILKEELGDAPLPYSLSLDNQEIMQSEMADLEARASAAIAYVSRFYMVRNGDLILLGAPSAPVEVGVEHHVDVALKGQNILSFNIK